MSSFRDWLVTLADAEAVVPARVVLDHLPEMETGGVPTGSARQADLTIEQVAAELGRSPSTVRGWRLSGAFPGAYLFNGREWRIPTSDVTAYLDRQRVRPPESLQSRTRKGRGAEDDLGSWRRTRQAI